LFIPAGKEIRTPLTVYAILSRDDSTGSFRDAWRSADPDHAKGPIVSAAGAVLVSATEGVVETHVAVAETVMVPAVLLVLSNTPALPPSTATVTGFPESVSEVLWPPYRSLTHEAGLAVKVTLQFV
jgi:hypothetical protein